MHLSLFLLQHLHFLYSVFLPFFFFVSFLMVRGKDSIRPWRIQTTVRGSHSLNAECLCYCQRTSWKTNVSFFWVLLSDAKVIKTLVVPFVRTMGGKSALLLKGSTITDRSSPLSTNSSCPCETHGVVFGSLHLSAAVCQLSSEGLGKTNQPDNPTPPSIQRSWLCRVLFCQYL